MIVKKPWFTVVYMFVLTAFFSSAVIALSRATRERVETNRRIALERAVLEALAVALPADASALELHALFTQQVRPPAAESHGAFRRVADGRTLAYALPVEGRGFWAPVRAVVGLDADRQTLTGLAVYEQNETPGLGAEIAKPGFTGQFRGRRLGAHAPRLRFKRPGLPRAENEVHAVTGATQTSVRLERIINAAVDRWLQRMNERHAPGSAQTR